MNLEIQLSQAIKEKILREIQKHEYTKLDYNDRIHISKNVIENIWNSVDWDKVITLIKPEIEKRICNAIIRNMNTEIKTDVKKLMAVEEVRQRLLAEVYPKLMEILKN